MMFLSGRIGARLSTEYLLLSAKQKVKASNCLEAFEKDELHY